MQYDVIRFLKSFVSNQTFEIISILTYTYLPNSILYRPKGKITKTNELSINILIWNPKIMWLKKMKILIGD